MDDFRSSYRAIDGCRNLQNVIIKGGYGVNNLYYAQSRSPQPQYHYSMQMNKVVPSSSWSFNDAEMKRKRRVIKYKLYSMEGKVKSSIKHGFRWFKRKCARMIRNSPPSFLVPLALFSLSLLIREEEKAPAKHPLPTTRVMDITVIYCDEKHRFRMSHTDPVSHLKARLRESTNILEYHQKLSSGSQRLDDSYRTLGSYNVSPRTKLTLSQDMDLRIIPINLDLPTLDLTFDHRMVVEDVRKTIRHKLNVPDSHRIILGVEGSNEALNPKSFLYRCLGLGRRYEINMYTERK
ncbi:Protein of unknown function DUF3511 [Dillenia turbinata]|uniref:Ubiquitin-like domain-containing protein n=2 Tax=Dillenia turbinata TaxID=194707 RepID=A0AAN8UIB3_9MAGN